MNSDLKKLLLCFLMAYGLAQPCLSQSAHEAAEYPSKAAISSALSNAETAFDLYESDVSQMEVFLGQKLPKDREVLDRGRQVIAAIKKDPQKNFKTTGAMILLADLDDASRNELLSSAQLMASVAAQAARSRPGATATANLNLAQVFQRTSQLLYAASGQVFDLGLQSAEADSAVMEKGYKVATECIQILKQQKAHGTK